jgi:flagellin
MPLSINTNIASLTAQRAMLNSNSALETSFERLSTGKRVNSASDDAAGLAIGKDLESRVSGLNQAIRNVNDGISMVQIAEGALDEVTTILQRMRDLSVQASNDSLSATERGYLDTEHSKLATTLGQVIDQSQFNGTDLVSDSQATPVTIQSGADAGDTIDISFAKMSESVLKVAESDIEMSLQKTKITKDGVLAAASGVGDAVGKYSLTVGGVTYSSTDDVAANVSSTLADLKSEFEADDFTAVDGTKFSSVMDVTVSGTKLIFESDNKVDLGSSVTIAFTTTSGTSTFAAGTSEVLTTAGGAGLTAIDAALATVADERAKLGATQQQLESTVRNLANVAENTAAAQGRIMDTDYAAETANLTKAQILQQAATSILAQANAQPQSVLSLLQ